MASVFREKIGSHEWLGWTVVESIGFWAVSYEFIYDGVLLVKSFESDELNLATRIIGRGWRLLFLG